MRKNTKIIFIQLPLLNHSHDYIVGNIGYASAAIAGYIHKQISGSVDIINLPDVLTQFGSHSMILKYIAKVNPDIVAFTCFLWNIERSLYLAQLIKDMNGTTTIVFGGSEIYPGSVSLNEQRGYIDYFVVGEGEWFFQIFLSDRDLNHYETIINGNHVIKQPAEDLIPAHMIFEPLSGNRLNTMIDGSAFFELTRGCPYKCSYCFYSKNFKTIREIPFDLLLKTLSEGRKSRSIRELYILSPSLNQTEGFLQKLEKLSHLDHGISLHSEMRTGGMNTSIARSLHRAGFRSMEVGLQTTNRESLSRVGRKSTPEKEIEGMKYLKDAGIELKIGLMPGLPGDTKDSFLTMTNDLIDHGFKENLELYPLMILPGTAIRDTADISDVNYLRKPPYYYNYGWGMSFDDLKSITRYVEDATGLSHIIRKLPDFTKSDRGLYCRGICLCSEDLLHWDNRYTDCIETNVFDFYISISNTETVYQGLSNLFQHLPEHQLFNINLYSNTIIDEMRLINLIQENEKDTLFRRINIFHEWRDGLVIHLHQVFDDNKSYYQAKEAYTLITPIYYIQEQNVQTLHRINDYEDNILIARGMFAQSRKHLSKFIDSVESVAFEDADEQEEFYRMIGYDYMKLPYIFRVIT